MRQFKSVLKFEYLNYLKSKTFVGVTIFLLVIILIVSLLPQITGVIDNIFSSDSGGTSEEMSPAALYDESGLYTPELMNTLAAEYNWEMLDSLENVEQLIAEGTYDAVVHIDNLDIFIYQSGSSSMYSDLSYAISEIVKNTYQSEFLATAGLSEADISAVLLAQPTVDTIAVGKDTSQSFWLSYVVLFVLYFALIFYGAGISGSVVTEKTSKAMELLITSAKPMSLMFGKVMGVGLAGLSQLGLVILFAVASINLNIDSWSEFNPFVASILQSSLSFGTFVYVIVFFLLGFFSYAFIYAALASTVSRVEDANSVTMIPQLLIIVSFFVAMAGLATPEALYIKVLSFVPFISPLIMFLRVSLLDVPLIQVLICATVNVVYILGIGFISSKIYRVGIMLYGNKPKLKTIVSYIRT